jgi:hypothetical protein
MYGNRYHNSAVGLIRWPQTNATFHFTHSAGASASVVFNGTGVSIIGAKRPNHVRTLLWIPHIHTDNDVKGSFIVNLDGTVNSVNGSTSINPGEFNQTLFHKSGLNPLQQHSITLSNTPDGTGYVDIDYLLIETGDGKSTYASSFNALPFVNYIDSSSHDTWLDDTSTNITYDSDWQKGVGGYIDSYYNKTF